MKKRMGLMGVMALAILLAMSFPMMAVAEDPVPPGGITEGEVITNPGYIKGAIFFGDVSKYSVKPYAIYISATGKDSQGKTLTSNLTVAKDQTQYEMVVQIPTDVVNAGGTQHYTLICYVRYGTSDEYFYFKHQEVDVPFNNKNDPKIADFVVNPGYITGPLTTNCQIKSGWIKAVLGDCGKDASCVYTRIEFVNPDPTKYANFYFPVQPNQNIRVWGEYTRTDGWTFKLEEKLVTVVEGQELYPGWAIGQCDGEPDCSAIIKGQFGLEGLGSNIVGKQNIGLTGATARHADFTTNSPYIFDGLQPGDHYLYSTIYLNPLDNTGKNFDDTFIPPHADWQSKYTDLRKINVQCYQTITKDIAPKAAFVNGKLSFRKDATVAAFKNDQNPEVPMVTPTWAAIWGYGLFGTKGEGGYRNGVSADIVEADSGKYDLILSEGEWNVYQTEIRFYHQKWMDLCGDGKLRYVNSNMNVADYSRSSRNNQQIALSAGQELNSNNFLFESGAATIKFFINGSGKMENPRLDATSSDSSERSVGLLGVGIATSTDGSTGEATIIGPPGTYNLTARAEINGTLTTFGDLKITLVAGACQSFEIGAPTLMLDVTNNCNNEVTVSGKATDKAVPIQSVQVNGQNIAFTATGNADNEVSFSITLPLQAGENKIETSVTNNAGKTASDSRTVNAYPAGAFIVGDEGIVKIDWLYDGGKYQGQFGIFSLDGMSQFTPGSPEFITEAVNRVLSDSEQGYLVFSDLEEGARFSGILGHEIRDWNAGPYKGVKSFPMKPGSCFATVLVPNSTFSSLSQNPASTDTNKRPLFSLVSANSAYGMVMGQMADVNGMGKAYSYEDKNAETSDRDFNDLIVQITGATGDLPTIDSLRSQRSSRDKREYGDWRDSAFGQLILEHVEASEVTETTPHITVTLASSAADMVIYDPQKRFIGKDGGTIPGAAFEMKSGVQTVSLTALTAGDYRIVLRSVGDGGSGTLGITGFVGNTQVASEQMPFEIAAHQSLDSILSADAFLSSQTIAVEIPGVNELGYDFNGDGVTDNADVALIVRHWNSCRNQQKYDPFFDLNDDGCITVADVMKVLNAKTAK